MTAEDRVSFKKDIATANHPATTDAIRDYTPTPPNCLFIDTRMRVECG